ncbi:hypothetical protein BU25DRAFT_406268 [Macroventuria anomochaeta]|uniref:Uncharacterized protein n=1 Tax=Macroventuria anomochaeta TaxID=301207 RepID=A0ACB6SHD2_9PLEO|nr:uncharacterized protein BU25DRAFT_406268 [Macroventuria anomochaeta]KAF2632995.1 hypothetical protein BU25DRAFT_406268 [Macroventuria anomochaeta]
MCNYERLDYSCGHSKTSSSIKYCDAYGTTNPHAPQSVVKVAGKCGDCATKKG